MENPQENDENTREANLLRVQFQEPHAKNIVSPHSGSILAQEEPRVPLTYELEMKIRTAFKSLLSAEDHETTASISKEQLCTVLTKGFALDVKKEAVSNAMISLLEAENLQASMLTMEEVVRFASRFYAPSYHFGQRLRRNASRGQVNEVIQLISRGCSVNTADGEGLTALHYAAEFEKLELIQALKDVAGDQLIVDPRDKSGWTPLYCACHHGNYRTVELLLSMNASPNIANNFGKTPLHAAAAQNRFRISELLLKAKAKCSVQDKNGFTPLHEAAFKGYANLHKILAEDSSSDETLIDRVGKKSSDYLEGVTDTSTREVYPFDPAPPDNSKKPSKGRRKSNEAKETATEEPAPVPTEAAAAATATDPSAGVGGGGGGGAVEEQPSSPQKSKKPPAKGKKK